MLNQPGKNVVISPFSINSILYMCYLGSSGNTQRNMQQVMGIKTSPQSLSKHFGDYLSSLHSGESLSNGYSLGLNNGMWIQKNLTVLQDYRTTVKDGFDGYISDVDFAKPAQVVYAVNNEITKASKGRINDFLDAGDIDSGMRMLLTNVYYFKGEWKFPFSSARTRQAVFHPYAENKPVMTRTMFGELMLPYYEDKYVQAIALPIKSKSTQPDMEMVIILPRKESLTPPFNYLYNGKSIQQISLAMRTERVKVALPKFTFVVRVPLIGSLSTLGMTSPFSPEANFSVITGKRNLFISELLTQSYFSVSEGGIVASAGSTAGFQIKSSVISKKAKVFEANHPFVYILRDSYSDLIHFIGEYDAPNTEKFSVPKVTLEPQAPEHQQQGPTNVNPLDEEDSSNPSGVEGNPSEGP